MVIIGIIGGSGLDDPDILDDRYEKEVVTPFGKPSDVLIFGKVKGIQCILLARHGRKHDKNPTNLNYRANIWALKEEGCICILVSSAVGSLQENVLPGDIVLLDQFIDRTTKRTQTFYDGESNSPKGVCHIPMAKPFSNELREILISIIKDIGLSRYHENGTVVVIEGPRFSSKAESKIWQSYGASVVGMTSVPEVVLANEAGIPYASISLVTDMDSWKDDEHVSVDKVMKQMKHNAGLCKQIFLSAIPKIAEFDWDPVIKKHQDIISNSVML